MSVYHEYYHRACTHTHTHTHTYMYTHTHTHIHVHTHTHTHTGDLSKLKDSPITIKEGVQYRLKIQFRVQREIVAGLRYFQSTYRKGVRGEYLKCLFYSPFAYLQILHFSTPTVDKSPFMVGSYGPKTDPHVYQTPIEDAPSGMLFRGNYSVKSKFTDDDKKIYLEWEWAFHVKKEWDS